MREADTKVGLGDLPKVKRCQSLLRFQSRIKTLTTKLPQKACRSTLTAVPVQRQ